LRAKISCAALLSTFHLSSRPERDQGGNAAFAAAIAALVSSALARA
jgi:hypothetical protein